MSTPSKTVCIWAATVECLTFTIARTASLSGAKVQVVTKPKDQGGFLGHTLFYEKLEELDNVTVLNRFEPVDLDWLYIETAPGFLMSELMNCARYAKHIAFFSSCGKPDYARTIWAQLKESKKYFPVIFRAERVFLIDGFYPADLYSLWAKRYLMGFDVHSNFLGKGDLHDKMFAFEWRPEAIRKYKLNFIGNRNPRSRTEVIHSIKSYLTSQNLFPTSASQSASGLIWIEYGDDPGEKRGVAPIEFVGLLSESDFTLSPPGYVKLTHRVVEALVRGSIPVLHEDELELYDMNLRDRVNCIAVKDKNWVEAVELITTMSQEDIVQMRSNILAMQHEYLSDEAFTRRLATKLGLV